MRSVRQSQTRQEYSYPTPSIAVTQWPAHLAVYGPVRWAAGSFMLVVEARACAFSSHDTALIGTSPQHGR